MNENAEELTTLSGKHFSKIRDDYGINTGEQLYSCVYKDFGSWRPVADYRTANGIIKFASQNLFDDKTEAESIADKLVDELMRLLGIGKNNRGGGK